MKEKNNDHRRFTNLPTNERDNEIKQSIGRFHSRDRFSLFHNALQYFLIFIGIAFTAGLSWMIYSQIKNKSAQAELTTLSQDTFAIAHPQPPECVIIAQKFLNTSSVEELEQVARLVRMDASEALIALKQCRDKNGDIERVEWVGASEINGLSMEMVMVTYKSGYRRIANLLPNESHDWLIDLESFVSHNSRPWEQITGTGSCRARVRVIASQGFYFNGVFSDEQEWKCLALTSLNHEKRLLGYVKNKSAIFDAMREIFKSTNPAPVILEISRDAGMEPLQYEITKVIAQGWVESDVEFQSRFSEIKETP